MCHCKKEFFGRFNRFVLIFSKKVFIRRIIMNNMNVHRYKNGDSRARRIFSVGVQKHG